MPGETTVISINRRSQLRANTRRRLLQVGRRAFASKGLASTNLKEDVLRPARVSVGSFYHQFHDKTELFLEILRGHSETFRDMIREAHRRDDTLAPVALAHHSYATVFRVAEENEDLFRIMARERETHDPRVQAYLRENHRLWVETLADDYQRIGGMTGQGLDQARLAAELVISLTLGTLAIYLEQPVAERAVWRERLLNGLVRFSLAGVSALLSPSSPEPSSRREE